MVYITLRNGRVDQVFNSWTAANTHCINLRKKWNIMEIVEKEVSDI